MAPRAGSAPRVTCVGDDVTLRPAMRVARCLGASVTHLPRFEAHQVAETRPDAVLVQWTGVGVDEVRALRATRPDARIGVLADPSPPADIKALMAEPWFEHLIGVGGPWHMPDLTAVLSRLLDRADDFGLHSWLPWGTRIIEHTISGSAAKDSVFDGIEAFMADIGMRGRLVRRMADLADEMLMNAIYDAPRDRKTGAPRYANQRRGKVVLEPDERPVFAFGSDGQRFAMSIRDPFGALTPDVLRTYIHKGLRREDDQIDRKEGGAGLGLFLLFEGLNTVCLNLVPGRLTEFIGLVNIRGSVRETLRTPKSFHIFSQGGA